MTDQPPSREHLPHACGVYIMRDAAGAVLYVGKAIDLAKRVAQYFNPNKPDPKNQQLAPLIRSIDYIHCASEREALIWERRLILEHQPFFNVMWKDGKSYPYVKVSWEEDFPRLRVVRSKRRDGGAYFGPYPKVTVVRGLLRTLWKRGLFPLRPCDFDFTRTKQLAWPKINACLYYHTRECPAPCAGRISFADYRRIAERAVLFFSGHTASLRRDYERGMRAASRALRFEEAGRFKENLEALAHMSERVRYQEVRPERVLKRLDASDAVSDLQQALELKHPPHAIECFDVSHLYGQETVASMVRFQGGEAARSEYRHFRIRTAPAGDDFAAIREAVGRRYRRLKDSGTVLPDLVLIDGGKGQLAAAGEALAGLKLKVSLASLAKQEEEVFLPGGEAPLRLERSRPALRLLQRVRDEAHRFAVSFHRLRRDRRLFDETAG